MGGGGNTFNGAATFQLRIEDESVGAAESDNFPSMEPQLFSCGLLRTDASDKWLVTSFNGAATFQLRIGGRGRGRCTLMATLPSMEPQLFSCGLLLKMPMLGFGHYSFNGAATFQLRIVGVGQADYSPLPPFNGAATFQLRIAEKRAVCLLASWSPFNGAATFQLRIDCAVHWMIKFLSGPSMEPQLFSCGLSSPWCDGDCKVTSFNGAATFQLRIAVRMFINKPPEEYPSMEPQLFSCGLLFLMTH